MDSLNSVAIAVGDKEGVRIYHYPRTQIPKELSEIVELLKPRRE